MIKHYVDSSHFSSNKAKYSFVLPEYPETTTDQSYYEPSATRIANMRKSASAMQSLYDFTGESLNTDVKDAFVNPLRKPGMTMEEVSAMKTKVTDSINSQIKESEDENKKAVSKANDNASLATQIADAISQQKGEVSLDNPAE